MGFNVINKNKQVQGIENTPIHSICGISIIDTTENSEIIVLFPEIVSSFDNKEGHYVVAIEFENFQCTTINFATEDECRAFTVAGYLNYCYYGDPAYRLNKIFLNADSFKATFEY